MVEGWITDTTDFNQYLEGYKQQVQTENDKLEYNFQSTLDNWTVYPLLEEKLDNANELLSKEYGGGIDFALLYGSTLNKMAAFPETILSRNHQKGEPWFAESDIDIIIGLEDPDQTKDTKMYRQEAASYIHQNFHDEDGENGEYPAPKIHPLVHRSDFLVDTFREARQNWVEKEGDDKELIRLQGQPKGDEVYKQSQRWHNFMRGFLKGIAFPEKYSSPYFHKEIADGWDIILDEEESLREDAEFDLTTENSYIGDNRPNRADMLNRNHLYGVWEMAKRENNLDVPPDPANHNQNIEEPEEKLENIRTMEAKLPTEQTALGIINSNISDKALANIVTKTLQESGGWIEGLSDDEYEAKTQEIRSVMEDNISAFEDLVVPDYLNDLHFSRHNNVEDDVSPKDVEGDFEGLIDLLHRNGGYEDGFELAMASFVVDRQIKNRYNNLEERGLELEQQMHEITLSDLIDIEENFLYGEQSELSDF